MTRPAQVRRDPMSKELKRCLAALLLGAALMAAGLLAGLLGLPGVVSMYLFFPGLAVAAPTAMALQLRHP
jgi:hypothetical protein